VGKILVRVLTSKRVVQALVAFALLISVPTLLTNYMAGLIPSCPAGPSLCGFGLLLPGL